MLVVSSWHVNYVFNFSLIYWCKHIFLKLQIAAFKSRPEMEYFISITHHVGATRQWRHASAPVAPRRLRDNDTQRSQIVLAIGTGLSVIICTNLAVLVGDGRPKKTSPYSSKVMLLISFNSKNLRMTYYINCWEI